MWVDQLLQVAPDGVFFLVRNSIRSSETLDMSAIPVGARADSPLQSLQGSRGPSFHLLPISRQTSAGPAIYLRMVTRDRPINSKRAQRVYPAATSWTAGSSF